MAKPTKEQIEAERGKLLEMMPNVRRFSSFGDDHHEAIKACMRILDGRDTPDDYDDASDNVRDEAWAVQAWMNGEGDPDYISPSDNWKQLATE